MTSIRRTLAVILVFQILAQVLPFEIDLGAVNLVENSAIAAGITPAGGDSDAVVPTETKMPTPTMAATGTPTATKAPTHTALVTLTNTPTVAVISSTQTSSASISATPVKTSLTATSTPSITATPTITPAATKTGTPTSAVTGTLTPTGTTMPTKAATITATPTKVPTITITGTPTVAVTGTSTPTSTPSEKGTALVKTLNVTNIINSCALVRGFINWDGGSEITERGFVYSTGSNPTIEDSKYVVDGTTGLMLANLTDLTGDVKYYVKAYAKNSSGISYGTELSFKTLVDRGFVAVDASGRHSVGLTYDGKVYAWGENSHNELGKGPEFPEKSLTPIKVNVIYGKVVSIATIGCYTAALTKSGQVCVWGDGCPLKGRNYITSVPVLVSGLKDKKIVSIITGEYAFIVITEDGKIYLWRNVGMVPNQVMGLSNLEIVSLTEHFALTYNGELYRWDNTDSTDSKPTLVAGLSNVKLLSKHVNVCMVAMTGDEKVYTNIYDNPRKFNVDFKDLKISSIAASDNSTMYFGHFLALTDDGKVYAWGRNSNGQLGINAKYYGLYIDSPTQVNGLDGIKIVSIDAGFSFGLALADNGRVYGWGYNIEGQVGDGTCGNYVLSATQIDTPIEEYKYVHYGEPGTNPATGNFSRTYTDMKAQAPGFEMAFTRTYNSMDTTNNNMGRGWSFGFDSKLIAYDSNYVQITLPDGSKHLFRKTVSEGKVTYTAEDSRLELTCDSSLGNHTLKSPDQYVYKYDSNGYLISMSDRNGNTITINRTEDKWTITDQAGNKYTVTLSGGLISTIYDETGKRTINYTYKDGLLSEVIDPDGIKYNYGYKSYNFPGTSNVKVLNTIKDNNGDTIETIICYETGEYAGRVKQVTDALDNTKTYTYDEDNKKTTITDGNGRITENTYDTTYGVTTTTIKDNANDKVPITSSVSYYVEDGLNKYNEEHYITDKDGNKTEFVRDAKGNVTKVINPDKSEKIMAYDEGNNLTFDQDEVGNKTYSVYEGNKLKYVLKSINKDATYTAGAAIDAAVRANFAVTEYKYYSDGDGYMAKGLVQSITDPQGNVVTYTYYPDGKVKTVSNPETGKDVTTDYYPAGFKKSETTAKGNRTEYFYTVNGKLEKQIQYNPDEPSKNSTTRITYDTQGRKNKEVSPKLYDSKKDNLAAHTYSDDAGMRYTYYKSGKIWTTTDSENNTTTYTYDKYGNIQTEIKPNKSIYRYDYDKANRLVNVYLKDNESAPEILLENYVYSTDAITPLEGAKRYLVSVTKSVYLNYDDDSEVSKTITKKDFAGRVVETINPVDIDGQVSNVTNTYYANGKVKEIKDAKGYIAYYNHDKYDTVKYDEKWTPVELVDGVTKYNYSRVDYDATGRKAKEYSSKELVDKDKVPTRFIIATCVYYNDGKVKSITYNDGRKTEYEYDDDRNVSKETVYTSAKTSNVVAYINNYLGKPSQKDVSVRSGDLYGNSFDDNTLKTITTSYGYDKNGNLETITSDNVYTSDTKDTYTVTYGYDNLNRKNLTKEKYVDNTGKEVDISSSTLYNWEGKPLNVIDYRGKKTEYQYNQRGLLEKVTDAMPTPGVTLYGYDRAGRKIIEVSPENYDATKATAQLQPNKTIYTYDKLNRIIKTEFSGEERNYDASGTLVVTNGVTVQKAYKYDPNGNVLKELDALGYATGTGATVGEKINNGYGTEYSYNPANKPVAVLDAVSKEKGYTLANAPVKYTYDALGRKVTETQLRGTAGSAYNNITTYDYNDAGNVLSTISKKEGSADGISQSATYDFLGNPLTKTDGNVKTTIYVYNTLNKVGSMTTPGDTTIAANKIQFQYDSAGNLKMQLNTMGNDADAANDITDLYTYDNRGKNLSHTIKKTGEPDITTYTSYDENGNKSTETDGNGKKKVYVYDELNRLKTETIEATDVDGVKTAHTTTYGYDKSGNKTTEADFLGNIYTNVYDRLNRLREKKDPYNKVIQKLNYYKNNVQSEAFDALNYKTSFNYDKNGRLLETIDPDYDSKISATAHKTSQTYDLSGNVSSKTDGNGNVTTYGYDEFNRLGAVYNTVKGVVEATKYTYDDNCNMLTQTTGATAAALNGAVSGGFTTTMTYNAANKLTQKIDHGGFVSSKPVDAKTESYLYYANGLLKEKTDRNGEKTTYDYYAAGWVKTQTTGTAGAKGTIKLSYLYDKNGNQTKVTEEIINDDGTTTTIVTDRTYDELNRVKTKAETNVGETTYKYDAIPALTDLPGVSKLETGLAGEKATISKGGTALSTTLKVNDKAGRLKYVVADGETTTYTYYDNGNRQSVTYSSGACEEYDYYKDNLLKELRNKKPDGTVMDKYVYTYDGAHNMSTKDEYVNGATKGITSYLYDVRNRLQKVTEPGNVRITEYTYDKSGNRDTETITEGTKVTVNAYEYKGLNDKFLGQNRLTRITTKVNGAVTETTDYDYDNNGNQTVTLNNNVQTVVNSYNKLNQLVKTVAGGKTVNNLYNGEGLRVEKAADGLTTRYRYEYNKVVIEFDGSGNVSVKNVIGVNLISRTAGSDKVYYMYNGHADVVSLVTSKGDVVKLYDYDAFGNSIHKVYFGDVNGDGSFDSADFTVIGRYLLGKISNLSSVDGVIAGDVNGDGVVDSADKTTMRRKALGIITAFPGDKNGDGVVGEDEVNSEFADKNEFRYAQYQFDSESGLYYLSSRFYDSKTARFLQEDTYLGTAEDPLSLNLYSYVSNNPLIYWDPTGHKQQKYLESTDDEKWYETLMRKAVNAEIGVGNFVDDPNSKFNELNGNIAEAVGVSKDNPVYKAVISPIVDGEAKVSAAINVVKAPVELLDFAYEHASTQVKMAGNEIAHCIGMADDGYYQRSMQDLMQKNNAYNKVVLSMPGELIKGVAHDVTNVVGNYDKFYNPFASLEEKTSVYTSGLNLLMIAEGCAEFAGLRVSGGVSKAARVSEFDFNNVPHYSSYSFVKTAEEMGLDGVTRDMAAHYDGPMPEVNIQEIVEGIDSGVSKFSKVEFNGTVEVNGDLRDVSRRVYQRNDINWDRVDDMGRTNLQRAQDGYAPLDDHGNSINLHHFTMQEKGPMVELTFAEHTRYSEQLHGLLPRNNYSRITPINRLGNKINRTLDEIALVREVRRLAKNRSFRNDPLLNSQYDSFRSEYWKWRASEVAK